MIICCAAVCGARDELRGRGVVDANVCGVADEAGGGYGECGDIRLFFHRFKNTHLLLSVSRTKAAGKDGGAASGKGTCPCSGRCIVVMTARLPRAGNGGDARSIA